jgi:AhpC/TSA family
MIWYGHHRLETCTGYLQIASMDEVAQHPRRRVGERIDPLTLTTLAHGDLVLPTRGLVHLQFRRFAGCPVCNLHLRQFAQGHVRLAQANILTVAFFHSPADLMRPYQGALPFPCIPDPGRRFYKYFGVERSSLAIVHPRVIGAALRGLVSAPSNPFAGGSEQGGLPADFMIDATGTIRELHYGTHADDQWSLEEVLAFAHVESNHPAS